MVYFEYLHENYQIFEKLILLKIIMVERLKTIL